MSQEKVSYVPTRKVVAAGPIGVPLAVLVAWMLNEFGGVDMPAEVSAALGGVISTTLAYLIPDKK